jgi:hypothetical protein
MYKRFLGLLPGSKSYMALSQTISYFVAKYSRSGISTASPELNFRALYSIIY